jgi:3'-5' exoribonuclease
MSKVAFIDAIQPNTQLIDAFLVTACEVRMTKTEKQFLSLKLRDRTGEVAAKMWDYSPAIAAPVAGDFVKIEAGASLYKDELQLTITRMRALTDDEIDLADFMAASKRDRDEMLGELDAWIGSLGKEMHSIIMGVLSASDVRGLLRDAPAAKANHQPYLGGLLEHILALCFLADQVSVVYPELDRELLIAAAILHDIGKIYELNFQRSISYSRRGLLLGHIVIGLQMIQEASEGEILMWKPATARREHLEHIIASHHGRREWGSPVVPMSREAIIFHQLDMIDSRMAGLDLLQGSPLDADGFTAYQRSFETQIWNGK